VPVSTWFTLTVDSWVHTFIGDRNRSWKCEGDPKLIVTPIATLASQTEDGVYDVVGDINNAALALPPFAFTMMKSDCS
jgi:hypothetical protein